MKQGLKKDKAGLSRVLRVLKDGAPGLGESMWPVDSSVVGVGNNIINEPYNNSKLPTQPRNRQVKKPKKKSVQETADMSVPHQPVPKKVKITPNRLTGGTRAVTKEGGGYATSPADQYQPVSTLNPGCPPRLVQPGKKKGKGLKKVCQVLKDGAEGGFDQARLLDAVGSSPGAPASELNPGNVGDKMPRVGRKIKGKVKKMFLPLDLKALGIEKGGPGSGRHKGNGPKEAALGAMASETGGNAEKSKPSKKLSPKERRANMAADSAALKEHGYTTTTGGYEHKGTGTLIQPLEQSHMVSYGSGARELVPNGKLKAHLDSFHGKVKKGLSHVVDLMKGGPGSGRHAQNFTGDKTGVGSKKAPKGADKAHHSALTSNGFTYQGKTSSGFHMYQKPVGDGKKETAYHNGAKGTTGIGEKSYGSADKLRAAIGGKK